MQENSRPNKLVVCEACYSSRTVGLYNFLDGGLNDS